MNFNLYVMVLYVKLLFGEVTCFFIVFYLLKNQGTDYNHKELHEELE